MTVKELIDVLQGLQFQDAEVVTENFEGMREVISDYQPIIVYNECYETGEVFEYEIVTH